MVNKCALLLLEFFLVKDPQVLTQDSLFSLITMEEMVVGHPSPPPHQSQLSSRLAPLGLASSQTYHPCPAWRWWCRQEEGSDLQRKINQIKFQGSKLAEDKPVNQVYAAHANMATIVLLPPSPVSLSIYSTDLAQHLLTRSTCFQMICSQSL